MGTRRLSAVLEFDVKGENELKQFTSQLKEAGNAGKQAGPDIGNAAKSTSGLGGAVKGLIAGGALLAVGKQLLDFGKASISAASDVEEMQSKFDTVFKSLGGPVTAELEKFADAANRSVFDLQGFAATLQDTFVPLGFARDKAADMSVEIVKLAEDLASFNNLNTEDVVRDLQSALVGNTETLRKYGVVASQAAVDQEALALGLDFTKGSMDAQTKAAAILSLTMKGTTDAQGDAIKTADSYANTSKGLEAAVTDLQVAIGQGLTPALTDAAKATTQYVSDISKLVTIKNILANAVDKGIITQSEFIDLQLQAALSSKTLAEVSEDVIQELTEYDEKQARVNARVHDFNQAARDQAVLVQMASNEIRTYHQGLAEAAGPNQEFNDKILQTNSLLSEEEAALARSRAELNLLTGANTAATQSAEPMVGILDAINERLGRLGNRHDFILNLDVRGLQGLEEAIRKASGFNSGDAFQDAPVSRVVSGPTEQEIQSIEQGIAPGNDPIKTATNSSGYKQ